MFKLRGLIAVQHNYNDIDTYEPVINLSELKDFESSDNITRACNYFK